MSSSYYHEHWLADLVTGLSGSASIWENLPCSVPIFNHSEQIANADKFQKLGLGIEVRSEKLTPKMLVESVDACIEDPSYIERSRKVMEISKRYDGVDSVVRVIESYL